jgi:hypothetical protein
MFMAWRIGVLTRGKILPLILCVLALLGLGEFVVFMPFHLIYSLQRVVSGRPLP